MTWMIGGTPMTWETSIFNFVPPGLELHRKPGGTVYMINRNGYLAGMRPINNKMDTKECTWYSLYTGPYTAVGRSKGEIGNMGKGARHATSH